MDYQFNDKNVTLMFEFTQLQEFAIIFNYTKINENRLIDIEYDITNRDILKFEYGSTKNTINVIDSFGETYNKITTDDQKKQNWEILGYAIIDNVYRIKITRYKSVSDNNDYNFTLNSTLPIGYLLNIDNNNFIINNYNRGVKIINFEPINQIENKYERFTNEGHSIFLFIFWGILADVGIFFGRQLKSYPKYAKVHGMIFLFQSIITYIFVFSKIEYNKIKIQEIYYYDNLTIAHFIVGIFIICFIFMQLFMGMIVKNNLESLNGSERIYKMKKIHFYLGYLLYLISKAQVAMGVHLTRPDLLIAFYYYYILLFFTKMTIEILYYYEVSVLQRKRITYQYQELDRNQIYDNLIEKINQNIPRNQLVREYQKLNYIILREAIYDVSDFNHPGGQYILERIAGREIGRYFYGGYPIQNLNIKMHIHSQFAINYIETRYIGDYRNENCQLLYFEENMSIINDRNIWKFEQYIPISDDVGVFYFQSHFFQIKQFLKGVQWLGRYFYIKPFGTGIELVERPYSVVMCFSTANINRRQTILDYFKSQIIDQEERQYNIPGSSLMSNEISFIIKKCNNSQNMSRFLHCTGHKPYEITGPYGLGLELDSLSDGVHYAFLQGTGLLPFLDLIDFILRKSIYSILHDQRGKNIADFINDNNEDYLNTLGKDFQLILNYTTTDIQHIYGLPIIQDLLFINKTFHLEYFDLLLKIKDKNNIPQDLYNNIVEESEYSESYMKKYIKYKPSKIYVCGNPEFEEQIIENLQNIGIPKKYIVII